MQSTPTAKLQKTVEKPARKEDQLLETFTMTPQMTPQMTQQMVETVSMTPFLLSGSRRLLEFIIIVFHSTLCGYFSLAWCEDSVVECVLTAWMLCAGGRGCPRLCSILPLRHESNAYESNALPCMRVARYYVRSGRYSSACTEQAHVMYNTLIGHIKSLRRSCKHSTGQQDSSTALTSSKEIVDR